MERWNIENATFQVNLCRQVKDELYTWWNAAQHYWDSEWSGERAYDPEVLLSRKTIDRWGVDNIIPYAMQVREANIMAQPLSIKVEPYGDASDMTMLLCANGLDDLLHYFENRPESNRLTREVVRRMSLFNAVAEVDWYDTDKFKEGPKIRVIPHDDIFMDINAIGNFNEINGPRWCAVRYRLTDDEVENMFPGKVLEKGVSSRKQDESYREGYHDDRSEIYEWFGVDESRKQISDADAEASTLNQIAAVLNQSDPQIQQDDDHDFAIKYAQAWLMAQAEEATGQEFEDYYTAQTALAEMGAVSIVEAVVALTEVHQQFIDDGVNGGTEPVYPGSIYRAVFQHGQKDPIVAPELYGYAHGQIPVSFYRAHQGSRRLFSRGMMTQVLTLQAELEWWEKARMDITNIAGRPPMIVPIDLMAKRLDASGRKKLVEEIKRGFAVLWTSVANYQKNAQPAFATMGGGFNLAILNDIIDEKRQRMFEIMGATAITRGQAPLGAEASGKRVQIQQAAAARPLNDTLAMIESPRQKRCERMVMNMLQHTSYELMQSITGMQRAQAIMQVRESFPEYRPIVKVDFGHGMPTDWFSKYQIYLPMFMAGALTGEQFAEEMNLGIKLNDIPQAPAANPGQTAGNMQIA